MPLGFDPDAKAATMRTKYMVKTAGDRWFPAYLENASNADQLAWNNKVVGYSNNPTNTNPYGLEVDSEPPTD